jgi:hypothetical protein
MTRAGASSACKSLQGGPKSAEKGNNMIHDDVVTQYIEKASREQLVSLNKVLISRIREIDRNLAETFSIGDEVEFEGRARHTRYATLWRGKIIGFGRRYINVVATPFNALKGTNPVRWRVSASSLKKVAVVAASGRKFRG